MTLVLIKTDDYVNDHFNDLDNYHKHHDGSGIILLRLLGLQLTANRQRQPLPPQQRRHRLALHLALHATLKIAALDCNVTYLPVLLPPLVCRHLLLRPRRV
jgi:hypothetical protein